MSSRSDHSPGLERSSFLVSAKGVSRGRGRCCPCHCVQVCGRRPEKLADLSKVMVLVGSREGQEGAFAEGLFLADTAVTFEGFLKHNAISAQCLRCLFLGHGTCFWVLEGSHSLVREQGPLGKCVGRASGPGRQGGLPGGGDLSGGEAYTGFEGGGAKDFQAEQTACLPAGVSVVTWQVVGRSVGALRCIVMEGGGQPGPLNLSWEHGVAWRRGGPGQALGGVARGGLPGPPGGSRLIQTWNSCPISPGPWILSPPQTPDPCPGLAPALAWPPACWVSALMRREGPVVTGARGGCWPLTPHPLRWVLPAVLVPGRGLAAALRTLPMFHDEDHARALGLPEDTLVLP